MANQQKYSSRYIDRKIAESNKARTRVLVLDVFLGADFARRSARGWRENGVEGLRSAAWDMMHLIAGVPESDDAIAALRKAAHED